MRFDKLPTPVNSNQSSYHTAVVRSSHLDVYHWTGPGTVSEEHRLSHYGPEHGTMAVKAHLGKSGELLVLRENCCASSRALRLV